MTNQSRNETMYGIPTDADDLPEDEALEAVETAKREDCRVAFTFCKYGHTSDLATENDDGTVTVGEPGCCHRPLGLFDVLGEFWRAPLGEHVEFLDEERYALVAAANHRGMVHCYRQSHGHEEYRFVDEQKLFHGCSDFEYRPLFGGEQA